MNRFFIIVLFFISNIIFSQDLNSFNSIYNKTYLETSQKDMKKALKIADSLFSISQTPILKTKSMMLSATLYQQSGDLKKAIQYALKSEEIINNTDNELWKARIYGFLATQYRILKLYKNSKMYMDMALEACKRIDDPKFVNNTKGLMMQEMAYYESDLENYKKAIYYINQSQLHFNLIKQNNDFFTLNNEQLLGLNYYKLNDLGKSTQHYNKALKMAKDNPPNFITYLVYNGLANIYLDQKNLKEAKKYIDLMQNASDKSYYLELRNVIYDTSQRYYELTKDIEKLSITRIKQDSLQEGLLKKSDHFIDESYLHLNKENITIQNKYQNHKYILFACILLLSASIILFIFYRKKQKKAIKRFKEIVKKANEKKSLLLDESLSHQAIEDTPIEAENLTTAPVDPGCKVGIMPIETEEKLIGKLKKFERTTLFNRKNLSLPYLAAYCNTNTRYLSFVINTYKKKDFYNYINELRINYIIDKLTHDPEYRKFKIAILAEECGFSSQNKFTAVFKKETGIIPSLFIKLLDEKT
ncbi:helix-turn-helix domain-containing protein [Elizabethkingia anophelis]|nr:helix-turn-helix domain-containing protein [Elizabethkingia anophelis]MDV3537864.1 AraC family transcriptional regulator [Elizabethkingia anophelis]MYZ60021.1 helix-turn-helix domain-containing protein [Elizabethkingia anophelis]HDP3255857.1 helix-turn-helix domain-containing protein [Elizabethkingia anophelis]